MLAWTIFPRIGHLLGEESTVRPRSVSGLPPAAVYVVRSRSVISFLVVDTIYLNLRRFKSKLSRAGRICPGIRRDSRRRIVRLNEPNPAIFVVVDKLPVALCIHL